MAKKNLTPLEITEQATVVKWLDNRGIKLFTGTAQSTYTGWAGINKNIKSGVRKGLPDLIICIPPELSRTDESILCFIEMKRKKGGTVSRQQKEWLAFLKTVSPNVKAIVARGADEAIFYLVQLLKPREPLPDVVDAEYLNSIL